MPLTSGTIPSMIGGVSQQDPAVRLPSQLESAVNCNLSPARGLGPRPPAEFVEVLGSDIPENAFWHSIVRDSRERYVVCIYGSRVRVFDQETGQEYVVITDSASLPYLTTHLGPDISLRAVTISDYTIIANREVVTKMSPPADPPPPTTTTVNTSDGGAFGIRPPLTVTVNTGIVTGTVQTFEDLPKTALGGSIWEVRGDTSNAFDNYYVQCESSKVWREVAKPGIASQLDATTMPHGLKRIPDSTNPDGFYFSYGPLAYDQQYAGDELSSPPPSFIGQRIGNLSFHKDRLVIVAGSSVVLSEIGYYFNFWRTTVTSLLDSDVIDEQAPSEGVAEITHAVPYQDALILMASGKTSMFQLTGQPTLTPKSVVIEPVTGYEASPFIAPALAGSSLFFVNDTSDKPWACVREYFVQDDQVTPEAADITAHVPSYIPGNTRCMVSAPDANLLLMAHRNPTGSQVFVHQFRWAGDQKQQSAWHEWKIEGTGPVVHMSTIGTTLYVLSVAPGGGVEMTKMDLGTAPTFPLVSSQFDAHLDRRTVVTPVYQQFGNYTDITLPFIASSLETLAALKTTDWAAPGAYLDLRTATLVNGGQTIRIPGKPGTGRVVVGFKYRRTTGLSQQFVRDQDGNTKLVGRLQIKRMTVRFSDAAYFECQVFKVGRNDATDSVVPQLSSAFTARTAGAQAFLSTAPVLSRGTYSFLVASRSDTCTIVLTSDSPYAAWFQSAQWEGLYTAKVQM